MKIEFINGEKVIIHPTGVVSKYTQIDLQKQKAEIQDNSDRLNIMIAEINTDIVKIKNSLGA